MGEKAATNEVINRLLLLLGDTNDSIRSSAYAALGKMGEKAANNEVINRVLLLLDDTNDSVRNSACEALGEMGEKAATSEVINRLLLLLGDTSDWVRSSAYAALGKMGEKAATNEVINRLLILLGDTNPSVRSSACEALGKMCEKIGISKLLGVLLDARGDNDFGMKDIVDERTGKVFGLLLCMANSEEDIFKEDNKRHFHKCWLRKNSFPEEFIKVFLHTNRSFWLPIIERLLMQNRCGITVTENSVVVYGSKEPVKLALSDGEVSQRLRDYLFNWLDKWLKW
jgi:predicted CopG family antitoxin